MILEKLKDIIADHTGEEADTITAETALADLGIDSLTTVEILMDIEGLRHHHIRGKVGIECIRKAIHRNRGGSAEICHIAFGVDTRIGPAAAGDMDLVAHHHGAGILQSLADRSQLFLDLPAVVMGAEIGHIQGNISHTPSLSPAGSHPEPGLLPRRRR